MDKDKINWDDVNTVLRNYEDLEVLKRYVELSNMMVEHSRRMIQSAEMLHDFLQSVYENKKD